MGAGQSNDVSPKIGLQIAAKISNPAGLLCRRIWYSVGKSGVLGIKEYRQDRPLNTSEGLLICFAREYYYTSCFLPVFAITVIAGELVKVFTWRPVIWVLELEDREKVFVFEAGVKVFVVVCIAKVFALGHRVNIFVLGGM